VYPSAQCVATDESYDPEEEENNCDCPKHVLFSQAMPALASPFSQ